MQHLTKIIIVVLVLAVGIFVTLTVQTLRTPASYEFSRKIEIAAQPEAVFAKIKDLSGWPEWLAMKAQDPDISFEWPASSTQGVGSVMHWKSEKLGEGEIIYVDVQPLKSILYASSMHKWNLKSEGHLQLEPLDGKTVVTWTLRGTNSFWQNFLWGFFGMQKQIERDFDQSLERLNQNVIQSQQL